MKKRNKWLAISFALMILFFLASGFFFLKSDLVDFRNNDINYEVLKELEIFNIKLSEYLNIPTDKRVDIIENMTIEEYKRYVKENN